MRQGKHKEQKSVRGKKLAELLLNEFQNILGSCVQSGWKHRLSQNSGNKNGVQLEI